ncbi:MAG: hypothetical protein H7235_00850 [Bdellovibrionaceae bacterium]|nr:hypothetical protein [Pseudobdellovibrionaceae bacterium]
MKLNSIFSLILVASSSFLATTAFSQVLPGDEPLRPWFSKNYVMDYINDGMSTSSSASVVNYPDDFSGKSALLEPSDLKVNWLNDGLNSSSDERETFFMYGSFIAGQKFEIPLVFTDQHYVASEWVVSVTLKKNADAAEIMKAVSQAAALKGLRSVLRILSMEVPAGPFIVENKSTKPNHVVYFSRILMNKNNEFKPVGGWKLVPGASLQFFAQDLRPSQENLPPNTKRSRINSNSDPVMIEVSVGN